MQLILKLRKSTHKLFFYRRVKLMQLCIAHHKFSIPKRERNVFLETTTLCYNVIIVLALYCFTIFTQRVCLHVFCLLPNKSVFSSFGRLCATAARFFSSHRLRALFKSHYLRHHPSTQPVFWFNISQYGSACTFLNT